MQIYLSLHIRPIYQRIILSYFEVWCQENEQKQIISCVFLHLRSQN